MRRRYGVQHEAMTLIRPDGYIAFRYDAWAPERLRAYLDEWQVVSPAGRKSDE